MFIRRFKRIIIAAAFTAAMASAQTTAAGTVTETSNTPAVGLASSETAQINLVNTASDASNGTAASCAGTVTFLNASGAAIGSATPFTVAGGAIQSVSLPFGKSGATGIRTEIRAAVSRTITLNAGVPSSLQIILEKYDASSAVTHVYAPNAGSSNIGIVSPVIGGYQPH